jgi:formylglycine-generating enzyme required for sulfatase activity
MISWYDAVQYCDWLSAREGLRFAYTIQGEQVTWNQDADGYRLPTEAEWEYACRAGTGTRFNTGDTITQNDANYNRNYAYNYSAKGTYPQSTAAVGSFAPNDWGLYDMHGNVWEWCWDMAENYTVDEQHNPIGASAGMYRTIRGGGWSNYEQHLRSSNRDADSPATRTYYLGFRVSRFAKD